MPQSLVQNYQHIVFSTKMRQPFLRDASIRREMHAYLGGVCRNRRSPSIIVGGAEDHVHIFCRLSKSIAIDDFLAELKRESSKWVKTKAEECLFFYWQSGYGAFSVSPSHVEELRRYITQQEEHHRRETFQEEYRRLLRKYGLEWDERFIWD